MDSEQRTRLRALLAYWIEHNREHSQEFREWADQAKAFGEVKAGEEMLQAAQEMDKASDILSQALSRLEG
jgi:nickel/cobalt exporter